jgi:hypothetical protein
LLRGGKQENSYCDYQNADELENILKSAAEHRKQANAHRKNAQLYKVQLQKAPIRQLEDLEESAQLSDELAQLRERIAQSSENRYKELLEEKFHKEMTANNKNFFIKVVVNYFTNEDCFLQTVYEIGHVFEIFLVEKDSIVSQNDKNANKNVSMFFTAKALEITQKKQNTLQLSEAEILTMLIFDQWHYLITRMAIRKNLTEAINKKLKSKRNKKHAIFPFFEIGFKTSKEVPRRKQGKMPMHYREIYF